MSIEELMAQVNQDNERMLAEYKENLEKQSKQRVIDILNSKKGELMAKIEEKNNEINAVAGGLISILSEYKEDLTQIESMIEEYNASQVEYKVEVQNDEEEGVGEEIQG